MTRSRLDDKQLLQIQEAGSNAEKRFGGCSQAVMLALEDFCYISPEVFKAATGLAGGIGLTGTGPCGSFIGGCMLIGQMCGRGLNNLEDQSAIGVSSEYIRKYKKCFDTEYSSVNCADIQRKIMGEGGFKLYMPEDYMRFESLGGHADKCNHVVGKAATWLARIVEEIRESATSA